MPKPKSRLFSALEEHSTEARHAANFLSHVLHGDKEYAKNPQPYVRAKSKKPTLVLVQGFLANRRSMKPMAEFFYEAGFSVLLFDLQSNWGDIRESTQLLASQLEQCLEQYNISKIDLIGHSMGGVISLCYVKEFGGAPYVRNLLMLGSPLQGTPLARIAGVASTSARQVRPQTAFLRSLTAPPLPKNIHYFTISAKRDLICPRSTNLMPGAIHIDVPMGHASLVMDKGVFLQIQTILEENTP